MAAASAKAFSKWARGSLVGGARAGHAFVKQGQAPELAEEEHQGILIFDPQEVLECRASVCKQIWTKHGAKLDTTMRQLATLRRTAQGTASMELITVAKLNNKAISCFNANAGQGADWWRIPELKALPEGSLQALAGIFNEAEEQVA